MASGTIAATQIQTTNAARGRRGHRGRRGNARAPQTDNRQSLPSNDRNTAADGVESSAAVVSEDANDTAICWICAEPVKYYAVSECDHRTCHVCTLRLRALYKKGECTFCKASQASVIFTLSHDALFSSFTPDRIPYKDHKLSILFETKEMMEETYILLRFNCPDSACDYSATGWSDLKLHVRGIHNKMMCDLCVRNKHVFAHEHALYTPGQLATHLPSMRSRTHRPLSKDQVEGGIHPFCKFCHECYFDDDQLFSHLRGKHEECFMCKRNDKPHEYFLDYNSLEKHFHDSHHPCSHSQCLAQKFVVFNSALDLKAHMVEEHGAAMTSRDKKDARRVPAEFEFEGVGLAARNSHPRRGGDGERERELLRHNPTPPPGGSSSVRPNGSRRREGFVSTLTEGGRNTSTSNTPGHHISPLAPSDRDPLVNERYLIFNARLQALNEISSTAQRAVEAAVQSFSASESSARDLISTVWNISDQNLEDSAAIVNAIVDFLEEEGKRHLLASWNGFKIEQRKQFPDLIPADQDTGYAGIASGRVLNPKHLTTFHKSQQSSRQVWDRVAQAARSSSVSVPTPKPPDRSRTLQPWIFSTALAPVPRQGQRNTPWASGSTPSIHSLASFPSITSRPDSRNKGSDIQTPPPPTLSDTLFPELPTSSAIGPKLFPKGSTLLRNIRADSTPLPSAWASGSGGDVSGDGNTTTALENKSTGSGAVKKGKGKQKQVLYTLGTFPN